MFWEVSSLIGVLCPKIWKKALLRGEIFCLKWVLLGKKNEEFYADLKNPN